MHILFFAQAADAAGTREYRPDLPLADLETLWVDLLTRFPELEPLRPTIRIARNGEYVREGELFRHGDEIALIPPVSGG